MLSSASFLGGYSMKKTLGVMVLLIGCGLAVSLLRANTSNSTSAPTSVVAKGKFVNQTSPIPQRAIYLPVDNGLYRISAYATVTTPSSTDNTSFWQFNTEWTDDSGQTYDGSSSQLQLLASNNFNQVGAFDWMGQGNYGATLVLEVKGGTPISISTSLNGPPDGSAYSLYYTLERLQ
jgi:hypothetical protein